MSASGIERLVTVSASDDAYSMPLGVMLHSMLSHYRGTLRLDIHIIDDGISLPNRNRIEGIVGRFGRAIRWLSPPESALPPLAVDFYYSRTTYYRLFIPDLLPKEEKVLYLDCDLVVQEDVGALWAQDVAPFLFLAAQDEGYPFLRDAEHLIACPGLELEGNAEYFNAGVLVVNLDRWRETELGSRALDFLRTWGKDMPCADQDALNALAQEAWGQLDGRWNQCVPTWDPRNMVRPREDGIVHYMGPTKPWSGYAVYPSIKLFERYLHESGWYTPLEWLQYRATRAVRRTFTKARYVSRGAIQGVREVFRVMR